MFLICCSYNIGFYAFLKNNLIILYKIFKPSLNSFTFFSPAIRLNSIELDDLINILFLTAFIGNSTQKAKFFDFNFSFLAFLGFTHNKSIKDISYR